MDPLSLGLEGAGVLSSLFGLFGGGDDASQYTQKAIEDLIKIKVPDPEQQRLALERFRSAGDLSPELESAIKSDPSAFEKVVQNTKYSQAQDKALNQLQSLGEEGGLNLNDKADLQEQMIENANKDKSNRDAITDDMARRGQLGSGMSLQAQLEGTQAAGDRDAQNRLKVLGSAQDRALQSIAGAGELAGNMQSADYQRQSDLASARDRINQFNTQNAQSVQQRNVASRNEAASKNLENQQNVMNSNTELANKEQQYNKELYQKQFDNQMQKAGAMNNAYAGAAANAKQQDAQTKQAWGGVGSGLGQFGSSVQNQSNWDKWLEDAKKKKAVV